VPNDPNASVSSPSAPVWRNWSGNLVHQPASDGVKYYFTPTTFAENPQNTWFGNLDLIGFVKKEQKPSDYSPKLLQFFADVERE
jgi:hypothetical protein